MAKKSSPFYSKSKLMSLWDTAPICPYKSEWILPSVIIASSLLQSLVLSQILYSQASLNFLHLLEVTKMHSPKLLSSLPSLVLTCTTFLSFGSFANAALKMDFTKVSTSPNMLVRRAGTLDVIAQKSLNWTLGGAYRTNITLGNPPQSMEVFLDTGSSNLALNTPTSCKDRPSDQLCLGGSC